jgi:hypothetical protein
MNQERFKHYMNELRPLVGILTYKVLEIFLDLIEEACDFGFIKDKLKLFVFNCSFGTKPNIYYINNGRDKIILDSIDKLWVFIQHK